jgi:hypothetical protein
MSVRPDKKGMPHSEVKPRNPLFPKRKPLADARDQAPPAVVSRSVVLAVSSTRCDAILLESLFCAVETLAYYTAYVYFVWRASTMTSRLAISRFLPVASDGCETSWRTCSWDSRKSLARRLSRRSFFILRDSAEDRFAAESAAIPCPCTGWLRVRERRISLPRCRALSSAWD